MLAPRESGKKSSHSMKLNAAQTMYFALASIDIMEPLIKSRDHAAWLTWKKLVQLLRFVVQHEVDVETGPDHVARLADEFLEQFALVEEWKEEAYEKPKFHLFEHLADSLREWGPWRAYWCMPWEGFLQAWNASRAHAHAHPLIHPHPQPISFFSHVACNLLQHLKRIFEGCNYINGPLAVGKFWSIKFVMRLRDSRRASWYTDSVESTENFTTELSKLAKTSPLVSALLGKPLKPYAVRSIISVTRERVKIKSGDWVHVVQQHCHRIARVRELVECLLEGEQHAVSSVVRIWCDACVEPRIGDHGEIWASPPPTEGKVMLVCMEDVQITPKVRNAHEKHDAYT